MRLKNHEFSCKVLRLLLLFLLYFHLRSSFLYGYAWLGTGYGKRWCSRKKSFPFPSDLIFCVWCCSADGWCLGSLTPPGKIELMLPSESVNRFSTLLRSIRVLTMPIEKNFDIPLVADLAPREKQIFILREQEQG
jgi:hypothetical protein